MRIVDANIILRYVLCDHDELSYKARQIIDGNIVCVPIEVLCEVVFVLLRVYKVDRRDIGRQLCVFFEETFCILPHREVVLHGLKLFEKNNLDFVDCVLLGYSSVEGAIVDTFDSKIKRMLRGTP